MGQLALAVGMPKSAAPSGWKWVALTDVARLESGHTPSRKHSEYWGGEVPWLSIRDAKAHHAGAIYETIEFTNALGIENSSARILPAGTVCLSRTASVGYVVAIGRPMATSQDFVNWVCSKQLEPRFLQYLLIFEGPSLSRFSSGAVHQTIYFPEVKAFHICLPPLEEQRRIVALLDEAFAAIGTATANAEKNVANAEELFSSFVKVSLQPGGEGLRQMKFGDFCQLQRGFDLPTKDRRHGSVPLVSSSGVIDAVDRAMVPGPGVITGRSGSIGKVFFEEEGFWPLNTTLYVKDFFANSPRFVYHFLRAFDLSRYATGAGVPTLNRNFVNDVTIWVPSARVQELLASAFDELEAEVEVIGRSFEAKIEELASLKHSLLHRAFSGDLTEREPLAA